MPKPTEYTVRCRVNALTYSMIQGVVENSQTPYSWISDVLREWITEGLKVKDAQGVRGNPSVRARWKAELLREQAEHDEMAIEDLKEAFERFKKRGKIKKVEEVRSTASMLLAGMTDPSAGEIKQLKGLIKKVDAYLVNTPGYAEMEEVRKAVDWSDSYTFDDTPLTEEELRIQENGPMGYDGEGNPIY